MEKLTVKLKNCFGIQQLEHSFDWKNGRVYAIYARNGLMKTSLAKTFQKIRDNKEDEIKDSIFNIPTQCDIKLGNTKIHSENIFVIKSLESHYEGNVTPLLVNPAIQKHLSIVLEARKNLLKKIEILSGCKIERTKDGRSFYELEELIVNDFGFKENSLLLNLDSIHQKLGSTVLFSNIKYSDIFDPSILKKIQSSEFQGNIKNFLERSNEVYNTFGFLKKAEFTLSNLKIVTASLESNCFFVNDNALQLNDLEAIKTSNDLKQSIKNVENVLFQDDAYKKIEKSLNDKKGTQLRSIIESNLDFVSYLQINKLDELKQILWLSYIQELRALFDNLYNEYTSLSKEIEAIQDNNTLWHKALDIFNKRFSVPFKMDIENCKSTIIGESAPKVIFKFTNTAETKVLARHELDDLDTLSLGEKRALYLLNIIFDIETIKQSDKECLFIIDDIADSFDYKNKYAIIEYIYEMSENPKFNLLILSHNFDFYRTISSRLGLARNNRLLANIDQDGVLHLDVEKYQKDPFIAWKTNPQKTTFIALIPFTRNLIQFGVDKNISTNISNLKCKINSDYEIFTHLLHQKSETNGITFDILKQLYNEYIKIGETKDIDTSKPVIETLFEICDDIKPTNADLEYKILLSMAIRHKAEIYMINQINNFKGILHTPEKDYKNSKEFLKNVDSKGNQTRSLFNGYKQFGDENTIKLIDSVNIMTPESIHLNSFMYEPLIDMDIIELLDLYKQISALLQTE